MRSQHRDQFQVVYETAVRPRDVQQAMLDHRPQVVHFCGHGGGDVGLILENEVRDAQPVSTAALARLFSLFANSVDCVLLNACYSEVQAEGHCRAYWRSDWHEPGGL